MGVYLNPGNMGFARIIRGRYIDKTGLISHINNRIDTPDGLVCISRPRRFGKSYAAQMLCAYYDHTCDSHDLFQKYNISSSPEYEKYINKFNVINIDMAAIISETVKNNRAISDIPYQMSEMIRKELVDYCPDICNKDSLINCFIECVEITGRKFVFIIDEWDAVIREAKDDGDAQNKYLNMLREWFKNNNFTPKVVAAAYMTGILPIKKDSGQSAVSDFEEFTIINPGEFTEYTGFTEDEVVSLCKENNMDFERMKSWYDGYYYVTTGSIYNPYSVMETIKSGEYESHWKKTSVAENLTTYINIDKEGLQADIIKLMSGESIKVNIRGFNNDFENFNSKDDVLTLLIHLGYLSYDKSTQKVHIPNEEVKLEFTDILQHPGHTKLVNLIKMSEKLLTDTLEGNEEAVANAIEKVRESNYAPQYYNSEQALRYAVKFAYIVCVDRFVRIEELPSGRGLADIVYIPGKDTSYPALIIELKWNRSNEEAVAQIIDKKYDAVFEGYAGEIVKVGIIYDEKIKTHSCKIERGNVCAGS